MKAESWEPPRLPQTLLEAIGYVAAEWSRFEVTLDSMIWLLSSIDVDTGACITAQIGSSGQKIDAIVSLAGLYKC